MTHPASALRADDLAMAEHAGGSRLGFPPVVEQAYRQHMIQGQHRSVIANWLIGIGLYDMFLANDYLVAPNDILLYAFGRLGCVTPVCLLALAAAFRFRRAYEYAICVTPLMMSAVLSILILKTNGAYRANYMFGDILLMTCSSVISRSRFRFTFWTIMIQCLWFGITLFGTDAVPADSVLLSVLFCISGAVVSLLTAYALEQATRKAFLMDTRIGLLNRELEAAASTDPLTGLANRRGLAQVTDRLWAPENSRATTVSLILIDVDRFKLFNDSYGHSAGDRCLATIAKQIASVLRSDDDLAVRFGGEELLVLLPNLDFPAARAMAERIRLAIAAARVPHPALAPGAVVTASLGVATATTRKCTSLELTAQADSALYAAKAAGRNCVWPPLHQAVNIRETDFPQSGTRPQPEASGSSSRATVLTTPILS